MSEINRLKNETTMFANIIICIAIKELREKKTAHTSTIAGDFSVCPFTSQFNVFDGMIR